MAGIVLNYFSNLFTGVAPEEDFEHMDCPRQFTAEQNAQLVEDLTFEEFTIAIKQMHPDKASGPDGLNPAFFRLSGISWVWKCLITARAG